MDRNRNSTILNAADDGNYISTFIDAALEGNFGFKNFTEAEQQAVLSWYLQLERSFN